MASYARCWDNTMPQFMDLPKLPPVPFDDEYPLFTRMSLETSGICNRDCWHCPAVQRGHKLHTMDNALYTKIVDELRVLNFTGVVQWFFVNEPLLDRQWEQRISYLRQQVPLCTIHVTSNWDVKAVKSRDEQIDTILRLFSAGVNSLNINDYDKRGDATWIPTAVAAVMPSVVTGDHNWKRIGPRKKHLSVSTGHPVELHTWSGYNKGSMNGHNRCARPMRHLVIGWDGSIYLCCAVNPTTATVFGNARDNTLRQLWNSRAMFEYRYNLQQGIRQGNCTGCVAKVAYSHVVRKVSL
jgi:GTP 3',8-cyclase